jgi:hypothetical protein
MKNSELICLRCQTHIAKREALFVNEEQFALLEKMPADIDVGVYCAPCFDAHVAEALADYNDKLEKAKDVNVFYSTQSKETRFVRRTEKAIRVENCQDRDDVILRLAFRAVESNKNSIVDVTLASVKVRNGGWQTTVWSGKAIPTDIEDSQLQRKYPGTPN